MIDSQNVKDIFDYCPDSGILRWKVSTCNRAKIGSEAGSFDKTKTNCYRKIKYNKKHYASHRVIWLHFYGYWPDKIDHINGIGTDNRIENLRDVSNSENQRNRPLFKNNKTGISGVFYNEKHKIYNISIGDIEKLGRTKDFFEACCIRKSAELKRGFHENHGRSSFCN